MFIENAVEIFLRAQAPEEFCHACVGQWLDIEFEDVAGALKPLHVVHGFTVQPGRCVRCQRLRLVAGFTRVSPAAPPTIAPGTAPAGIAAQLRAGASRRTRTGAGDTIGAERTPRRPRIASGTRGRRLVIVRAGAVEVWARLVAVFGADPGTVILYDRRTTASVPAGAAERRFPHDPAILATRGFFVTRPRWRAGGTARISP